MSVLTTEPCPRCAAECERHGRYPVWCRECGWNIEPHRPEPPASFTEATRARMSRWMGASVLGHVERPRRRLGLYRALTYLYALVAYMALIGCALGGMALIALTWFNPFAIVAGVILLGMAYITFPRPAPMPEIVDRNQFAHLYQLADQVADALGAHRVDGVAVDGEFNASFARYGWRAGRVITIGLPLFTALEGQERVALVAHEIAHDVNRDPARALFVVNAWNILIELYAFFLPQYSGIGLAYALDCSPEVNMVRIGGALGNLVLRAGGAVVRPFLRLFVVLMRRDSQRAEYLADALAADVAGDAATRGLLRKAHLAGVFDNLAKGAAARGEESDILAELRRWVADAPPSEWERVDQIMGLQQTQVASKHPPSAERIRFLAGRPPTAAQVVLTPEQHDGIDRELMPLEREFARHQQDEARSRLYR